MRLVVLLAGLAAVLGAARPAPAALSTCGAAIQINYVSGPNFPNPGDVVRVELAVGTGSILNGTTLTVNRIRFDLDCANPPVPGAVPCTDDGLVIGYGGDATITTNCPVTWSTGHVAGGSPNEIVFTPSTPLAIPANTFAYCQFQFDVQILGSSNDSTPTLAEEVAGYNAANGDAQCDNGLSSSASQSGSIPLCVCDDGDPCTDDSCDSNTGGCTFTPIACTTTTTVVTTTSTTTTTLLHGCAPPDVGALRCEKLIAKALAALVKSLTACSADDAKTDVGTGTELSADGDACEANAVATFDATVAKIAATELCPSEVLANASAVRDEAVESTFHELDEIFLCPAS
jgi:hypothetical protein